MKRMVYVGQEEKRGDVFDMCFSFDKDEAIYREQLNFDSLSNHDKAETTARVIGFLIDTDVDDPKKAYYDFLDNGCWSPDPDFWEDIEESEKEWRITAERDDEEMTGNVSAKTRDEAIEVFEKSHPGFEVVDIW